jgi:predicted Rdx family selenoprotein
VKARLESKGEGDVELIRGGGGIFVIDRDGERLYSKRDTGQFPTDDQVDALFR